MQRVTHLLEREQELAELDSAFADAASGRGRLVLLEGTAGTGKSALLSAAREIAMAAGLRPLHARGTELEREFPFGAVRQLFDPALNAASPQERERLLAGAAAPAEWALAPEETPGEARGEASLATLHAICWLGVNLAAEQPILLELDDAHWVDASSLRAIAYIGHRIADTPIALLVAERPAEPGAHLDLLDALRAEPGAVRLSLDPLGLDSAAEIVRSRIPDADDSVCQAMHDATTGNPLYLEELLRTVSANGNLAGDPIGAIQAASVPSLGDRIMQRVNGVHSAAPSLARAMAVLGDGARLSTAAALAGMTEADAAQIAHRLRRLELLSAEDPFVFVHPLVRRSIYDRLSIVERDESHAAAAELLLRSRGSLDAVTAHLATVRPNGSTTTAEVLLQAAERALARAAPDEAVRWLLRALEEDAAEPPSAEILTRLGMTELVLRDPAAIPHLQAALAQANDPVLRVRVGLALCEILTFAGQWEAGMAVIEAIEQDFEGGDPAMLTEIAAVQAAAAIHDPALIDAFERDRPRLREMAKEESWAGHAVAAALANAGAYCGEEPSEVQALAARSLDDGVLLSERGAGGWAITFALGALVIVEDYERALAGCDAAIEAARASGSLTGVMAGVSVRAWTHARRGDLAASEADLHVCLEFVRESGLVMLMTTLCHFTVEPLLERPDLAEIAAQVETIELDPTFMTTASGALLLSTRGRLRAARGDRQGAIDDLRACGETADALRMGPGHIPWRSSLALALPLEARPEALALAGEELVLARSARVAGAQGVALRVLGLLSGGDEGIARLRESAAVLESSEARLELARTRIELGAALRRLHRRAEARSELMAGAVLAQACGAPRLVERAREEVGAAGGRASRVARTGVDSLTASELRVVRLAASGATNPEIAQELYVSLKTVETHLSSAYGKLGLSGRGSRARLNQALGPERLAS